MRFFLLLFCVSGLTGSAQKNISASEYTSTPVVIDGRIKEWPANFRYYEGSAKLQFALKHDDSCLYLCFQTFDERAQLKILRAGMQVTVDAKAKKGKAATLTFPYRSTKLSAQEAGSVNDMKVGRTIPGGHQHQLYLRDFVGIDEGVYVSGNIQAAYAWDSLKNLNLEFRIPFHTFGYVYDPAKDIAVTVTVLAPEAMQVLGGNGGMGENSEQKHRGGTSPYTQNGMNSQNGMNPNNGFNNNQNQPGYNPNNPTDLGTDQQSNPNAPVRTDMSEANRFSFKAKLDKQ